MRPSTKEYFNRCCFSDNVGNLSVDFIEFAKAQSELTFDTRYLDHGFRDWDETPFKEIKFVNPINYVGYDYTDIIEFTGSYDELLEVILQRIKFVLLKLDPLKNYLFSHSSGSDSRIISGVMFQLKKEGMNFDNVLFHCWGKSEQNGFMQIMKKCGWENISIHDDSVQDAYNVGIPDFCTDGWNPYTSQMKFWGNINPSEYVLLSGAEGETFIKTYQDWVHNRGFFLERGESIHRLGRIFRGVFFPFLTHDMLSLTMSIPKRLKSIPDGRLNRDKLRTDLVEKLGLLNIPVDMARYNFNFSEGRKREMISLYNKSRFKRDFDVEIDFDDLFKNCNGWNSKCWSFAVTVYEQIA